MTTRSSLDARIRAAVSELVGAAPPAPPFPDADARVRANRAAVTTARRHRVEVVLVAVAVIAVFFVPLPHVSLFNRLGQGPTNTVPVTHPSCAGNVIPASRLSAITFFNATSGLGVWSRSTRCGPRLASTRDGGETWKVVGGALPAPVSDFSETATVVFPTARVGWVDGAGVLVTTRDGGTSWSVVRLGGWVATISGYGSSVWAFVAPCNLAPSTCRYRLEATTLGDESWREVGLLPASMGNYGIVVTRLSTRQALVANGQMGAPPADLTTDGGTRWSSVTACTPSGFVAVAFATTGPNDAWALCLGGGGMGSSLKSLARSVDGGRTWRLVAVDRSLMPGAPLPLPDEAGNGLAVASVSRLWMATVNYLFGSLDGGKTWFPVRGLDFDGGGTFASFSFVSSRDGWLLVPYSGLWRTTDGRSWRAVGQGPRTPSTKVDRVPAPGSRCSNARIEVDPGTVVPAPYLAAIQFLSSDTGVGLTASMIDCLVGPRIHSSEAFPVWQVVSTDGGQVWRAVGSALPKPLVPSFTNTDMAFSSTSRGWVEAGGALAYTDDGGHHWKLVRLGGTVTALQADGQTVAALVTQQPQVGARVWLLSPAGGIRGHTSLTQASEINTLDQLAVIPKTGELVVAVASSGGSYLVGTAGAGSVWTRLGEPCPRWGIEATVAIGGDDLAAVCSNVRAMNEEPKIFAISLDGGRSWQVRSAWRNFDASDPSGLPSNDLFSLASSPGGDLYMATTGEVSGGASVSRDGGSSWASLDVTVPQDVLDNGSAGAQFSFVSQSHGWLLLQSEALLRTVDGIHWTVLSSATPGT
ncbi:MAG: hypothetical protein WAV54_02550 [Acidimicrobiales bacterium]